MKIRAYFAMELIEKKRKQQQLSYRQFSKLITEKDGKYVNNFYYFLLKREFTEKRRYIKAICDWFGNNDCITFMIISNNDKNLMLTPHQELFPLLHKKIDIAPISYFGYEFYIRTYK